MGVVNSSPHQKSHSLASEQNWSTGRQQKEGQAWHRWAAMSLQWSHQGGRKVWGEQKRKGKNIFPPIQVVSGWGAAVHGAPPPRAATPAFTPQSTPLWHLSLQFHLQPEEGGGSLIVAGKCRAEPGMWLSLMHPISFAFFGLQLEVSNFENWQKTAAMKWLEIITPKIKVPWGQALFFLLCLLMSSKHQEQCLASSRCSINIYSVDGWVDGRTDGQTDGRMDGWIGPSCGSRKSSINITLFLNTCKDSEWSQNATYEALSHQFRKMKRANLN